MSTTFNGLETQAEIMAAINNGFKTAKLEENIPAGVYEVALKSAKLKTTPDGKMVFIERKFEIKSGDYSGELAEDAIFFIIPDKLNPGIYKENKISYKIFKQDCVKAIQCAHPTVTEDDAIARYDAMNLPDALTEFVQFCSGKTLEVYAKPSKDGKYTNVTIKEINDLPF